MIDFKVRAATLEDLDSIKAISASAVQDDEDYVPNMLADWLKNPLNRLYLFEKDGQPAGFYCLRVGIAGPTAGWIQAVRVGQAFKRQGLAGRIVEHAIITGRKQGLTVLRYTTAVDNWPMHKLARRYGFRTLGDFGYYNYVNDGLLKTTGLPLPCRLVTTSEFDGAYDLILHSPEYRVGSGFYCDNWLWKPLSIENVRRHIEQRQVFTLTGALKALAILVQETDTNDGVDYWWLGFIAGETQAQITLLGELVRKVNSVSRLKISFDTVHAQTPTATQLLTQAGFVPDAHEAIYTLFELGLDLETQGRVGLN